MSAYDPKRVFAGESFGVGRVVERGHVRPKSKKGYSGCGCFVVTSLPVSQSRQMTVSFAG